MYIVIIVFLLSFITFIYNINHDKLKFIHLKINTIEEKINSTLIKRKELLKEAEELIKNILKTNKNIFENINEVNTKINIIELDEKLTVYINEFYLIKDKYKKLKTNEEFQKITFAINETEDLLSSYKLYYNDMTKKRNKLIKKFPINIIAFIKRNKQKELFDEKEKKA